MGFLKKIEKTIRKGASNGTLGLYPKIMNEELRWAKHHKREVATYAGIVGGGALGGYLLGGAGAGAGGKALTKAGGKGMAFDIGTLLTPLIGGGLSAYGANEATKKQIAWERERATNAHQWEVQDLINAGLNPILSAGGSGAVTGGISAPVPDFSAIANSGAELARIKNENKLAESEVKNKDSQTGLNKVNTELGELEKELTRVQTANTAEQARKAKADADLALKTLEAETPRLQKRKKYNESKIGGGLSYLNMAMNDINPALTGLIGLAIGGGLKAFKGANSAQIATKEMKKNEKWVKSVLQDTKTGQVKLPMIQM